MNFVSNFVRRPVFTYVIFIVLIILGFLNLKDIPIEEEPIIPNNVYYIRVNYSSSLDDIENSVVNGLKDLLTIPGVELVTSDVSNTGCLLQVVFSQESIPHDNLLRIQDVILSAKHDLPERAIITVSDNNSNAEGIMTLYFTSKTKKLHEIASFISAKKNMIESINGVSGVTMRADKHDSYTLEIIPQNMHMFNVPYSSIDNAIRNIGISGSSCQILRGNTMINISVGYENTNLESYPVVNQNGYNVAIRDVAFLNTTPRKKSNISRINGKEVVTVEIQKKPDARLIDVCNVINKELIKIRRICELNDIQCGVIIDKSEFVVLGIHSVYKAIIEAIVLVCIIIFMFLRSLVLSIIPILAIPLSIIPMFSFMKITNTTINVYSLFGIVLAIGLVVDDAIVVIENIHKFVNYGYNTKDAAIKGTQSILKSIVAMTITLAIVYMPIFFVNDQNIKSFIDFVITITISVLISGFVALTITPTIFSQIYIDKGYVKEEIYETKHWWKNLNIMKNIEIMYLRSLSILMKNRYSLFIVIYFLIIMFTIMTLQSMKFEETIEVDRGTITFGINSKRENDIEIEYIDKQLQNLRNKINKQPFSVDITDITTNVSETMKGSDYIKLKLKNHKKRKHSIEHIIKNTLDIFKENASDCNIYTAMGTSEYKTFELFLQVYDNSYEELNRKYQKFIQDKEINQLVNGILCTDIKYNTEFKLFIDEQRCARYNVQPFNILSSLSSIDQHKYFKKPVNRHIQKLYVNTLSPETPDKLNDILNIPIETSYFDKEKGHVRGVVPVKNFIKIIKDNALNRKMFVNGINGLGIQVRLNPGVSKTQFYNTINKFNEQQDGSFYLKTDVKEERKIKAMQKTISLFFIAIIFIYLTLSALFESFIAPLSILLTVPGSTLGSLIMLIIFKQKLNIVSVIGLITLVGLITKHGIMLVDYIVNNKNKVIIDQLILEAALNRFQPILMTTLCMVIGSIPLINKSTEFNEYKLPIGIVIVGGMIIGTFLTLYVVPCMYLIIDEIYTRIFVSRDNYNDLVKSVILNHYNNITIENSTEDDNMNDYNENNNFNEEDKIIK